MILTPAFWFLFTVLDDCYFKCYEDGLGMLCGELNPNLWDDGLPMDMATVWDWYAVCNAQGFCEENAAGCILAFLEQYEKDYSFFSFEKTKQLVKSLTKSEIAEYYQKACRSASAE